MSQNVPPPPFKTQMQDDQGFLTAPWAKWFQFAFERIGGSIALSNVELSSVQTTNLSILQTDVNILEAKIDQLTDSMLTATSVPKIAAATGQWQLHSGNSLLLTAGRWLLSGMVQFDNGGSAPGWTQVATMWAAANGADSAASPAALSTVPFLTSLTVQKTSGAMTWNEPDSAIAGTEYMQAQNVIVSVRAGEPARIYLNSFCSFSGSAANTLITAFANATLLRLTP